MNKVVLNKNFRENLLAFTDDTLVLVEEDVEIDELNFKIQNCNFMMIDRSNINKVFEFENCTANIVEVFKESSNKLLNVRNNNSEVEYNIIDLTDGSLQYMIDEDVSNKGNSILNVASVCYKDKQKKFLVNTSNIDGYTNSVINCFGIVKDNSSLQYDVTSFIKNGAKKASVKQSSNILLFDKESVGENNPILIIEENDVKASHGSTIGKIDDDTMFYLCSRGLSKIEATNLICIGKIENLLNKITDDAMKEVVIQEFKERMR